MTSSTESFLKFSRRAVVLLLIAFLWLAATCLAIAFFPETILARWPMHAPLAFPAALVVGWAGLRVTLRGHRWDPHLAEVVTRDEFRQSNILRAQRAALIAVLLLQVPLALLALHLPVPRALVAMAGSTITIGMSVLYSAFLYLDRE
jgi:hypothetical protein